MSSGAVQALVAAVGFGVLALAVVSGVRDVDRVATHWSQMGPLGPGADVPSFRANLADGGVLDNASLAGQVTLLNFWATWCGVCERQMPDITELDGQYAGNGVRIIGVNQDRAEDQAGLVDRYRSERSIKFDMALDQGPVGQAFRVTLIPHVAILDKQGKLRFVHQGRVGIDTLREELDELLAE